MTQPDRTDAASSDRASPALSTAQAPAAPRPPIRFRGRSFLATVLAPLPPLADWLADLDALTRRAPAFFAGRPVILDLAGLVVGDFDLTRPDLDALLADLAARGIAVLGIEGAGPALRGPGLPPALANGRPVGDVAVPGSDSSEVGAASAGRPETERPEAERPAARSLILDAPVRSGQAVMHLEGDVTVMGAVASGAEVIAGGSIHVYGPLRGRAVAGAAGNPGARIYCRRFEPELVAIDGLYKTADDLDPALRGQAVEVRLVDDAIRLQPLDRG